MRVQASKHKNFGKHERKHFLFIELNSVHYRSLSFGQRIDFYEIFLHENTI